ncbi:MAG: S-layer homology domain-containing protein, partial [Cohnella sp.]|nr:S-layer homology domain-containing protein [Cohnella sp.]
AFPLSNGSDGSLATCANTVNEATYSYTVEMKIPFIQMPDVGTKVGFDVQVNDAKAGVRIGAFAWNDATGTAYQDLFKIGTLELVAAGSNTPAAPAGLTASALNQSSIKLDWNDDSSVTFSVYRGTSQSGPFSAIASGITASEFTDTGLSASTTYYYKVNAVKNNVTSADSAVVHATTSAAASNPIVIAPNQPAAEAKDGKITVKVGMKNGIASANVPSDVLAKALEQASVNAAGKKQILIDIPAQAGAAAYGVQLPVAGLKDSGSSVISIKTENGTVDLPGNMLAGTNVGNAGDVTVRVGKVSTDSLSEAVRNQIGDRPVINLEVLAGDSVIAWNNPNAAVNVAIPYKPTAQELQNPNHIIIWYIDGSGKATPVPNARYDAASGTVKFSTTHFSNYAVAFVVKTFDDLKSVPWAKKAIEAMASRGIINGTSEQTYDPNASIKRADFLALLVRALELKGSDKSVTMFSDVASSAYYYDAVKIAMQLGIVQGTGSNLFDPNSSISRQDMMVIAARAAKAAGKALPAGGTLSSFSDEGSVAAYAKDSVTTLVQAGIVEGSGGKLAPNGTLTRAEAAVILQRIWSK